MPNISRLTPRGVAIRVRALVDGLDLDERGQVIASLAVTTAACADRARLSGDPGGFLRASRELERLLDRLSTGGERVGESAVESGSDESDGLGSLLGSGPQVRDSSIA